MSVYDVNIDRDGSGGIIPGIGGLPFKSKKTITFTGGSANTIGDNDGTLDPFNIFTVTGDVAVYVGGVCKTDLAGATATLEVGVTGNTAILIPQTTATGIDVNMFWHDASVALAEGFTPQIHVIGGGLDIIGTVGTADITGGVIDFYCFWRPLSSDGFVVAA
jgi:hypothetical protein